MSLEAAIAENTAAVNKLIALMEKGGALPASAPAATPAAEPTEAAPAPAAEAKKPGRPKKEEPKAPAVSFDEVKAALLKVKGEKGAGAAKAIIATVGKADAMADMKPDTYAAVLAACEAALAPAPEPEAEAEDEL